MNKRAITWVVALAAIGIAAWYFLTRGGTTGMVSQPRPSTGGMLGGLNLGGLLNPVLSKTGDKLGGWIGSGNDPRPAPSPASTQPLIPPPANNQDPYASGDLGTDSNQDM